MNWLVALAVGVGVAASMEDLLRRRVSNWIPAVALVGGLGFHLTTGGWRAAGSALLATAAGFGVFLVFYCLGGMGGGDVKLMAGFGAVLGSAQQLLEAALWSAAVGGLVALAVIGTAALRRAWLRAGICGVRRPQEDASGRNARPETIPYAPAITLGAWLALMPKG